MPINQHSSPDWLTRTTAKLPDNQSFEFGGYFNIRGKTAPEQLSYPAGFQHIDQEGEQHQTCQDAVALRKGGAQW